jgi:hypothetical protein
LRPIGKGIWVPINAMQVLGRLGLAEQIAEARRQLRTPLCWRHSADKRVLWRNYERGAHVEGHVDGKDRMDLRANISLAESAGAMGARRCHPVDAGFSIEEAIGQALQFELLKLNLNADPIGRGGARWSADQPMMNPQPRAMAMAPAQTNE